MSRTTKISPVFVGLFILGTVCLSTHIAQVECEVCVTLHGTTTCRKGTAATREAAIQSAVTSVWSNMAGGMAETIACERTEPDRVSCVP
jgi:hypothetical protein